MEYFDFNGNKTEPKPFDFDNFKVELISPREFRSKEFSVECKNGLLKIISPNGTTILDEGEFGFLIKFFTKTPSQE